MGVCTNPMRVNASCNDHNPATDFDRCTLLSNNTITCIGIDLCLGVTCPIGAQCYSNSTCSHGVCGPSTPLPTLVPCNDGNIRTSE